MPAAGTACAFDDADLRGLLECLDSVPDPRRRRGMRHRAAVVLAFAVAAVTAGADSLTAISEWASDVPPEVLDVLGAWRDRRGRAVPPSRSTFRRVLGRLDGQALAAAFGVWLKGQAVTGLADAAALVIALDGKTARCPGLGEYAGHAHYARPRARPGRDPDHPGAARP